MRSGIPKRLKLQVDGLVKVKSVLPPFREILIAETESDRNKYQMIPNRDYQLFDRTIIVILAEVSARPHSVYAWKQKPITLRTAALKRLIPTAFEAAQYRTALNPRTRRYLTPARRSDSNIVASLPEHQRYRYRSLNSSVCAYCLRLARRISFEL